MWHYPDIDPVAISLGPISIHWYAITYLVGIGLVWWTLGYRNRRYSHRYNDENMSDLVFFAVLGVLLGGRIGYMLFYGMENLIANPLSILRIWEGGMSFHGALIGIIIGTYLFSVKKNLQTFFLLDIIACVSPIGIFFGRIANFINAELIGKTTSVSWYVIFPTIDQLPRHPSQLYEALFEGIVLYAIIKSFNNHNKLGFNSGLYVFGYGFFRFCIEYFREPDAHLGFIFLNLSMGQLLCIAMMLSGTYIWYVGNKETIKAQT